MDIRLGTLLQYYCARSCMNLLTRPKIKAMKRREYRVIKDNNEIIIIMVGMADHTNNGKFPNKKINDRTLRCRL